jgi:hypothetical protein
MKIRFFADNSQPRKTLKSQILSNSCLFNLVESKLQALILSATLTILARDLNRVNSAISIFTYKQREDYQ